MSDPYPMYPLSEKSSAKSPPLEYNSHTPLPSKYLPLGYNPHPTHRHPKSSRAIDIRHPSRVDVLHKPQYQSSSADSVPVYRILKRSSHPSDLNSSLSADQQLEHGLERLNVSSTSPLSNYRESALPNRFQSVYPTYDAINRCKSAGIIPYAIRDQKVYFLLQQAISPVNKKTAGWNDFGGKRSSDRESTADIAAREFSEETSCLFYLTEKMEEEASEEYKTIYDLLKDNDSLTYSDKTIDKLKELIPISQQLFSEKISAGSPILYTSSKEVYISYFVKVCYIEERDIPKAEDLHIPYEYRYIRNCKWFSTDEILSMPETDFHKRLQITKLQNRIRSYVMQKEFVK